jgi:hypothetical protein
VAQPVHAECMYVKGMPEIKCKALECHVAGVLVLQRDRMVGGCPLGIGMGEKTKRAVIGSTR